MPIEEALPGIEYSYFMLNTLFEILVLYMLLGFGFFTIKFVRLAIAKGMVLGFLEDFQHYQIAKPFFGCEYCMASVWGTAIYMTASLHKGWIKFDPLTWVGFCICLSGLMKYFDEKRERVVLNVYEEPKPDMSKGYATDNLSPYDN